MATYIHMAIMVVASAAAAAIDHRSLGPAFWLMLASVTATRIAAYWVKD